MDPDLSVTVETVGALVEGVWGNDRQEYGTMRMATQGSGAVLTVAELNMDLRGSIVVAGRLEDPNIFRGLASLQVRGVIAGSMPASLIPAAQAVNLPVILTEGFGQTPMNSAVFELFATNVGREASVNAQHPDPWKGLRPEAIIPLPAVGSADVPSEAVQLVAGRRVRVLRDPYAGAVGTIVSIYSGCDLLQEGRKQVAAMYILYGPRVSLVYSVGNGVYEFTMNHLMEYTLTRENVKMKPSGDIYAPGGLRNKYTEGNEKFVRYLEAKGCKLRYSGGFVPDINQVLMKGKGIFMYPALNGSPPNFLQPNLWPSESRPLRVLPTPFLCAIVAS